METTQAFLKWLLGASAQAGVLVCLVIVAQMVLRERLSARWRWGLWLLVVARLVMPWAPESRASVFNVARLFEKRPAAAAPTEVSMVPAFTATVPRGTLPAPTVIAAAAPAARVDAAEAGISWPAALAVVWVAVAALLAIRGAVQAVVFLRRLRACAPVKDRGVIEVLEACEARLGVTRAVSVVECPYVKTPALVGIARPCILLPQGALSDLSAADLRFVFLHELAHHKRRDLLVGWVAFALQCVHWFNPLIWYGFYRMRVDRELACDALVLSHAQPGESREYGKTIVKLLESFQRRRGLAATVGILEGKSQLRRRMAMIADFKPGAHKVSLVAVATVVVLAVTTLTNCTSAEAPAAPRVETTESVTPPTQPKTSGSRTPDLVPSEEVSPETAEVLKKLDKRLPKFEFHKPLSAMPDALRKQGGINVVLDPAVDARTLIDLDLANATVKTILDLATRKADVAWKAIDSYVYVSSPEGINGLVARMTLEISGAESAPPEAVEVRRRLQRKLGGFYWASQPFDATLQFLRLAADVNFVLDGSVSIDKTVTLDVEDTRVESILNLITTQEGLYWGIVENYVFVSDEKGVRKALGGEPRVPSNAKVTSESTVPASTSPRPTTTDERVQMREERMAARERALEVQARGEAKAAAVPPGVQIRAKLEQRVQDFNVNAKPLAAALDALHRAGDVNIVLDSALKNETPITLQISNDSIRSILDVITKYAGVAWTIVDGYVYVSDAEGIGKINQWGALGRRLPDVDFTDAPLDKVTGFIAAKAGVNIVLDTPVTAGKTVTVKLQAPMVKDALDVVTGKAGLKWVVIGSYVYVSDDNGIRSFVTAGGKSAGSMVVQRPTSSAPLDVWIKPEDIKRWGRPDGRGLTLTIHGTGEGTVPVEVAIYSGDPEKGGGKLVLATKKLTLGQSAILEWDGHFDPDLYVVLDPDKKLNDTDRSNNVASEGGATGGKAAPVAAASPVDVWITPADIRLLDTEYCRMLSATIHSKGQGTIPTIDVDFYVGDPKKGGKYIGRGGFPGLEAGKSGTEAIPWDAVPGKYEIFAVLDPDNKLNESDKTNNVALTTITITAPFKLKSVDSTGK